MNKKVNITIDDNPENIFTGGDLVGQHFVSVDFQAGRYGSGSPCINEEQVNNAVEHAKKWIIEEGDTSTINDIRKNKPVDKSKLTAWF